MGAVSHGLVVPLIIVGVAAVSRLYSTSGWVVVYPLGLAFGGADVVVASAPGIAAAILVPIWLEL